MYRSNPPPAYINTKQLVVDNMPSRWQRPNIYHLSSLTTVLNLMYNIAVFNNKVPRVLLWKNHIRNNPLFNLNKVGECILSHTVSTQDLNKDFFALFQKRIGLSQKTKPFIPNYLLHLVMFIIHRYFSFCVQTFWHCSCLRRQFISIARYSFRYPRLILNVRVSFVDNFVFLICTT